MQKLSMEPLDILMGGQLFKTRIKLIRHLIERLDGQENEKEFAICQINKAEKLADTRNVIAHNPWSIWIDFESKNFRTEIQRYTRKEKSFDLTKIREFTVNAQECASSLEYALGQLRFSGNG